MLPFDLWKKYEASRYEYIAINEKVLSYAELKDKQSGINYILLKCLQFRSFESIIKFGLWKTTEFERAIIMINKHLLPKMYKLHLQSECEMEQVKEFMTHWGQEFG